MLKLHPYQVFGSDLPQYKIDDQVDWAEINQAKEGHSVRLLNQLRQLDRLPLYKADDRFFYSNEIAFK